MHPRGAVGRPRSQRVELAIRAAALQLLAEGGFDAVTIEAVAARAGVGKATIYRRWPSRQTLMAAILRTLTSTIALPDTGKLQSDLIGLLGEFQAVTLQSVGRSTMARVMAAVIGHPELLSIFQDNVVKPRREMLATVLCRAQTRGELGGDVDAELIVSLIVGPVLFFALLGHPDAWAAPDLPQRLVATLLGGIGAAR